MPLYAPKPSENIEFEPIPAGAYLARCYSLVDLGTQEVEWEGQTKLLHKIRITFELPTELKVFKEENGEQPHVISGEYTLSMHERSGLRQMLESWRSKKFTDEEASEFDLETIIGVAAMVNVIHSTSKNGRTYANLGGVSPLPKGTKCPEAINPPKVITFDTPVQEWKKAVDELPQFLRDKIGSSPEYQKKIEELSEPLPTPAGEDQEEINIDDIDFGK